MRTLLSLLSTLMIIPGLFAQIPAGYYDTADSLRADTLRMALREIIKNHTVKSYSDLWTGYQTTDRHPDGYVWDMYSHHPGGSQYYTYTFVTDQCGSYSSEGDCYNREHTWPQSRFGDAAPMRTDIVLVVPTDGTVNGQRSNLPYGKVSNPSWTSRNGSKLGPNTYTGAPSGNAFEPIDEYKGDIARIMFYVVTRYYQLDSGWQDWEQANKATLKDWSKNMFLEWHYADPVSDKERERNNAIYDYQGNRNPYVDRPEFVDCVFNPAQCPWTGNPVGIYSNILTAQEVQVYPNPVKDILTIVWNSNRISDDLQCEIYNQTGQMVTQIAVDRDAKAIELNLNHLNIGNYFIKLHNETVMYTHKFIKQ